MDLELITLWVDLRPQHHTNKPPAKTCTYTHHRSSRFERTHKAFTCRKGPVFLSTLIDTYRKSSLNARHTRRAVAHFIANFKNYRHRYRREGQYFFLRLGRGIFKSWVFPTVICLGSGTFISFQIFLPTVIHVCPTVRVLAR